MPKTLNPQNTFPTNIPNFPISGNNEPIAIEPLENAIQAVLNRSENLHVRLSEAETQGVKRVRTVASLAALSAATGFNNGDVCDVEGYGRYRLYNPSGLTADGLWVLNAAGGGRWVHTLRDMRGAGNGLATLDSSQRLAQDVRDASILTQHIANQAVTSAKLASGAAIANIGYTPVNKAGDTMTGLLTVAPNLGQVLNLKGGSADHVYLAFYARAAAQNTRSGYIGYDAAGTDVLNIANELPGGLVAVTGTLQTRYDHQNRFVVQGQLGGTTSTSIASGSYYSLSGINIYIPPGKRLYLKRLRYAFSYTGVTASVVCNSYSYTGSLNYGDISIDVAMSNIGAGNVIINIRAYNPTGGSISISPADSVWAELEIR